jgi:hypothetical protein
MARNVLSVITWNCGCKTLEPALDNLQSVIRSRTPDVLLLQQLGLLDAGLSEDVVHSVHQASGNKYQARPLTIGECERDHVYCVSTFCCSSSVLWQRSGGSRSRS